MTITDTLAGLLPNPSLERRYLLSRKPQPQFGPPPQYILRRAGPFAVDQIGNLALAQAVPEIAPQIGESRKRWSQS